MKANILQEDFSKALLTTSRFVSTRAQLPILSNIVLKSVKTKILLMATNLEMSFVTTLGAKVEEDGEIAVPAKTAADLVSNLSKGSLSLSSKEEQLTISNENFESMLVGMAASEFPSIPLEITNPVFVTRDLFLKAISQVIFCTSSDETRPVLTGVLFIFDKNKLTLVATDGIRLSMKSIELSSEVESGKTILPKNSLAELVRVAQSGERVGVEIRKSDSQVVFGSGNTASESILSTRVIEGDFPPFEKIIPKSHSVIVKMDKSDLLRAVKASLVIARDSAYIGKLKIGKNNIELSSESARSGKQRFNIDARVEGDPIEIMFNLHFIEEFLNNLAGEDVEVQILDQASPGLFRDPKDPDFLHLIMPVKL